MTEYVFGEWRVEIDDSDRPCELRDAWPFPGEVIEVRSVFSVGMVPHAEQRQEPLTADASSANPEQSESDSTDPDGTQRE